MCASAPPATAVKIHYTNIPTNSPARVYKNSDWRVLAVEGDLRLVEQEKVANWVTGRPQVFFEGSWSQVCAGRFDNRDADVACRQLGFGAGTALVQELSREQPEINVFPEIALTGLNCTGTEKRLVDCETDPFAFVDLDLVNPPPIDAGCQSSISNGLVLGCVRAPENGATPDFAALGFNRCMYLGVFSPSPLRRVHPDHS